MCSLLQRNKQMILSQDLTQLKTWTNNKSLKRLVLVNKLDFTEDLPKQLGTGITFHGKKI